MVPDFSLRSDRLELMDDPDVDDALLDNTLAELARVNAVLGGYSPSLGGIADLASQRRELTVLDVGCGGGDTARVLARWADRQEIRLQVLGIDLLPTAIDHARRHSQNWPNLKFEQIDLFNLDDPSAFDIVHAALMLHHLPDARAQQALVQMHRLSRLGVVINDLHRHRVPYYASRILLPAISKNPMIRHDGALSILRAFRRPELLALVDDADLPRPQLRWRFPFRWQLVIPGTTP